jgi:hypothetical protein
MWQCMHVAVALHMCFNLEVGLFCSTKVGEAFECHSLVKASHQLRGVENLTLGTYSATSLPCVHLKRSQNLPASYIDWHRNDYSSVYLNRILHNFENTSEPENKTSYGL